MALNETRPSPAARINQVVQMAKRLETIVAKFDAINAEIGKSAQSPEHEPVGVFMVSPQHPPMQSFDELSALNGMLYVRRSDVPAILKGAREACIEDAKANARWALDRDLITESVAAAFLSHFAE